MLQNNWRNLRKKKQRRQQSKGTWTAANTMLTKMSKSEKEEKSQKQKWHETLTITNLPKDIFHGAFFFSLSFSTISPPFPLLKERNEKEKKYYFATFFFLPSIPCWFGTIRTSCDEVMNYRFKRIWFLSHNGLPDYSFEYSIDDVYQLLVFSVRKKKSLKGGKGGNIEWKIVFFSHVLRSSLPRFVGPG